MGSYHPSFLRRGHANLFPCLMDDLQKSVDIANGRWNDFEGAKRFKKRNYQLNPSIADAQSFYFQVKDNVNLPLGADIETPTSSTTDEDEREELDAEKDIIMVQFSLGRGTAIALPYRDAYVPYIHRILALDNIKLGFNWWAFDGPRLKGNGCNVKGVPYDLMWMFKHYQPNLPRGLQSVASFARFPFSWKHLYGSKFEYYGCADVDALHYIWEWLPEAMKELGVWQGYLDHLYGYYHVLSRASDIGMPVSIPDRIDLDRSLRSERDTKIKELEKIIPIQCRDIGPKRKVTVDENGIRIKPSKKGSRGADEGKTHTYRSFGYIKTPRDVKIYADSFSRKSKDLRRRDKQVSCTLDRWLYEKCRCVKASIFTDGRESGSDAIGRQIEGEWVKVLPLKMSKEQISRYIKWKKQDLLKCAVN